MAPAAPLAGPIGGLRVMSAVLPPASVEEVGLVVRSAMVTAALVLLIVLVSSWRRERPPESPKRANSSKSISSGTSAASSPRAPESAAACWKRMDGRFKFCGCRQQPFNQEEGPPRYSLKNLDDLPLPPMSEMEVLGVKTLQERVEDLAQGGNVRTDASTMIRFLRARKGNLKAAEVYFRQTVAYRKEVGLDRSLEDTWNLQAYEQCLAPWVQRGGIVGVSKEGGVIGWERVGISDFPQLVEVLPSEHVQKLDAIHMTRTLAAFEENALVTRKHICGSAILVLDLEGAGQEWMKLKVLRAYGKLVVSRDMLMPATLAHILIICAPSWFAKVYRFVVGRFLHPRTRDKVVITSDREASLEVLRRYMSDDVIPAYIGGNLHTLGDPECQGLLGSCSGEPTPQEAWDKFHHLLEHGSGAEIARRSSLQRAEEAQEDTDDRSCMLCMRSCSGDKRNI